MQRGGGVGANMLLADRASSSPQDLQHLPLYSESCTTLDGIIRTAYFEGQ